LSGSSHWFYFSSTFLFPLVAVFLIFPRTVRELVLVL
jgi:hypothetical protein